MASVRAQQHVRTLALMVALGTLAAPAAGLAVDQHELLGWWRFDLADLHNPLGYTADASGNNHHAVLGFWSLPDIQEPLPELTGHDGEALRFLAPQLPVRIPYQGQPVTYAAVPFSEAYRPPTFTWMAWILPEAVGDPVTDYHSRVLSADVSFTSSGSVSLSLQRDTACEQQPCNDVHWGFTNVACGPGALWNQYAIAERAVGLGTWTHLAGAFDGATLRAYVDGALVAEDAVPSCFAWGDFPLWIGARGSVRDAGFHGLIDEVKIFDGALSAEAIAEAM